MELAKIRNLSDEELNTQGTQVAEQLFRVRFQAKLGQSEGIRKLRELRKEIARVKTIAKERELGVRGEKPQTDSAVPAKVKKLKKEAK